MLPAIAATVEGELVSPEETQDVKTGYWPQIAEVHIKGMISVSPDSCIFPVIETLNSLTWCICLFVCLSYKKLLTIRLLALVANFYITWLLLLPPWSSSFRVLEMLPLMLKS